jgi:hypothetical protein
VYDTDLELLHALIHGFSNAMLVSRCGDGLRSRPMTVAKTRDAKRLWLLCGVVGEDFAELRADASVQVILQDGARFCAVTGTVRVARLPGGPQAAGADKAGAPARKHVALLEVRPQFAEYWDRSGQHGLRIEPGRKAGSRPAAPAAFSARHSAAARGAPPHNVIAIDTARRKK